MEGARLLSDFVKRLKESRANTWEAMKATADRAAAENRDLTVEEQTAWDQGDADIRSIDERVRAFADAEARTADSDAAFDAILSKPETRENPADSDDSELRAFLKGERRDLTVGSATGGGNTVPTSFVNSLREHIIENSGVLSAGPTVLNTTGGETIEVPTTTAFTTGTLEGEGDAIAESDPAFAKRSLGAYKYGAVIQVSRELIDDTGVDLLGFIARQAGRGIGNSLGAALVTGTGSSQPAGVVTGSTEGVEGADSAAGVFTADNLIDLYFSVIGGYRASTSAAWLMDDTTLAAVRKLKDQNDQYLWVPGLSQSAGDTILSKPVYTDPNVADVAATAKSVVFGDFSAYYVRLAGGVRFERSDDFAFTNDLVTFKCVQRGDGLLVDQTGAIKHFVGGAA